MKMLILLLIITCNGLKAQESPSATLKVAVDTTYPPMEFEARNGDIIGLDVDLARALAQKLKMKAEFVVMPWDGILAGLTSNRYDIIMSSMTITEDRKKVVDFVFYLEMGQVFVIRKGEKAVKKDSDLAGKVIAVQVDTTSAEAVDAFRKKGIAIKDVKGFKGATETFGALKARQADVIVIDGPVARYYSSMDSKNFEVSGQAIKPEPIGIAVRKDNKKLSTDLELALNQIKKDGTYSAIYKKWLGVLPSENLLKISKK